MSNGKGSTRRKKSPKISDKDFELNWDLVFKKKENCDESKQTNDSYDSMLSLPEKLH